MASFNEISDLKPFKMMWKIRVKIIRLWTQYSPTSGVIIEMVLIDSKGDKIHASVKKGLVKQFDPFLHQGASKTIINFSVSHSCGSYRTTNHPYKIMFLSTTRVRNCEELSAELNGFNPVNYDDIFYDTLDQDFLIDVISQIVNINTLEEVAVKGKDTTKLTIELCNSSVRLPIVLWRNFAKDVNKAIQDCDHDPIICVFRFGKIKEWKGNYSVSNAYNVSDVAINPSLPEVETFMLMSKDNPPLMIMDSKQSALIKYESHKDDFFVQTPRKTIKEVLESKQVEKCIVMATISGFDSDMGWYYLSCKACAKKILQVRVDDFNDKDDNVIFQNNYIG